VVDGVSPWRLTVVDNFSYFISWAIHKKVRIVVRAILLIEPYLFLDEKLPT
jgi:hypothetical protein